MTDRNAPDGCAPSTAFERMRAVSMRAGDETELDVPVEQSNDENAESQAPSPSECIIDAALDSATSAGFRERAAGDGPIVVIVTVPTTSWVKPVESRLHQVLGRKWSTIARDGSKPFARQGQAKRWVEVWRETGATTERKFGYRSRVDDHAEFLRQLVAQQPAIKLAEVHRTLIERGVDIKRLKDS